VAAIVAADMAEWYHCRKY